MPFLLNSGLYRPYTFFLVLAAFLLAPVASASAQSLIRDTEVERYLAAWNAPVFEAAGMQGDRVNIIIVNDRAINAFVAGGPNIFFFTGLLLETDHPAEVVGVAAHELGHIKGAHLISTRRAMEQAMLESFVSLVLGGAAATASGEGSAAAAVSQAGAEMARRRFLAESRIHENSADQAALRYMEEAGYPADGLLSFMQKLRNKENKAAGRATEYLRTHPLTQDRVQAIQAALAQRDPDSQKSWPEEWIDQHLRLKAKLIGFLRPESVQRLYPDKDQSVAARYARSIAAYRQNNVERALNGINALLEEEPANPYFHELKGQMLLDFGRAEQAARSYDRAVDLAPDAPLIRAGYGHALLESLPYDAASPGDYNAAIDALRPALSQDPRFARGHRLIGQAYGRKGETGLARLHLAEYELLRRRYGEARRNAEQAKAALPEGSPGSLRAQDVIKTLENRGHNGTRGPGTE